MNMLPKVVTNFNSMTSKKAKKNATHIKRQSNSNANTLEPVYENLGIANSLQNLNILNGKQKVSKNAVTIFGGGKS